MVLEILHFPNLTITNVVVEPSQFDEFVDDVVGMLDHDVALVAADIIKRDGVVRGLVRGASTEQFFTKFGVNTQVMIVTRTDVDKEFLHDYVLPDLVDMYQVRRQAIKQRIECN